jgi:hypothetical protein
MNEVIPNAPTAGNKARAGLSKVESARFFGPPPLVAGEDPAQYEAIRTQILAAVQPLDILEEIPVNDIGVESDFGGTKPNQKNALNQQSSGLCTITPTRLEFLNMFSQFLVP